VEKLMLGVIASRVRADLSADFRARATVIVGAACRHRVGWPGRPYVLVL